MDMRLWTVAVLGLGVVLSGCTMADTRDVAAAPRQLTPEADTWIEVAAIPGVTPPASAHGAEDRLRSGWIDSGTDDRALIRFAIPTTPPDHVLDRAELELHLVEAGAHPLGPPQIEEGRMRLSIGRVTSAWDETSLTGRDLLELGDPLLVAEIPWGPCDRDGCGDARIDVRALLEAELSAPSGSRQGWVLDSALAVPDRPIFGAFVAIASRESARPPLLRIEHRSLSQEPITPTSPRPLADLQGRAWHGCSLRQGVRLQVENVGDADAGPFVVHAAREGRWEIEGLSAGAITEIIASPRTYRFWIDVHDAVPERDEGNNEVDPQAAACPTRQWNWLPRLEGGGTRP